ncbi:hypothetical protein QE357_000455 [Siphonobacter sp. BAB-5404]|nr:hypothetical protein [Siphonobacter sp. SORGH_AS_0500]
MHLFFLSNLLLKIQLLVLSYIQKGHTFEIHQALPHRNGRLQ